MASVRIADLRQEIAPGTSVLVGRDRLAELRIKDPHVSRRHVRLESLDDGNLLVSDLGSINGLHVNGSRVPWAVLAPGNSFVIGLTIVTVDV